MDKQKVRHAPRLLGRAASIAVRLWNEEHLHRLLVGTRRFVLCALLMQANVFDGYAPFGLAMASAMMAHGAGLSAVGGVVCGAMLIDDGLLGRDDLSRRAGTDVRRVPHLRRGARSAA